MLRLTVSTEEYLMIGDNIKLVFLGGTKNHLRIMLDAPKDVNIVRSTVLENRITDPEEKAKLPQYYAEPELDSFSRAFMAASYCCPQSQREEPKASPVIHSE